jgi:nitrate reductase gamma subunit
MGVEAASRTVFLDIPWDIKLAFYLIAAGSVLIFIYGFWSRISLWMRGEDEESEILSGATRAMIFKMILRDFFSSDCFTARRVFQRSKARGVMLVFIMWSFVLLFLGTVTVALDHEFQMDFLKGYTYLVFSLTMDIAGLILLLSSGAALLRRYVFKPERIISYMEDGTILLLLFLTVLMGFTVEGLRLSALPSYSMDWSPVGGIFAYVFASLAGGERGALMSAHLVAWFGHFILASTFVAFIPYSKQFHMFAAQITTKAAANRMYNPKKEVRA